MTCSENPEKSVKSKQSKTKQTVTKGFKMLCDMTIKSKGTALFSRGSVN